jgi:hypothetical protein
MEGNMRMAKKKIGRKSKMKNKKGIELDMLGWWIIGIIILVIIVIAIIMLKGKSFGALNFIKDLFKFKSAG